MSNSSEGIKNTGIGGPGFVSILVSDLKVSADFYEHTIGIKRDPLVFPGAVAFLSTTIPFALRQKPEGLRLDSASNPVAVWFKAADGQAAYEALVQADVTILKAPFDGPFGRTFVFSDPDGYAMTVYEVDEPILERLPKP
jgi:predicted enzyme related to lactoylglutathione lyase